MEREAVHLTMRGTVVGVMEGDTGGERHVVIATIDTGDERRTVVFTEANDPELAQRVLGLASGTTVTLEVSEGRHPGMPHTGHGLDLPG